MKKVIKPLVIVLAIVLVLILAIFMVFYISQTTLRAVVVKVNDNSLLVEGIEGIVSGLYYVKIPQEDIDFKVGQEILISFNGDVVETAPAQLGKVKKIKIVKEESDVEISKKVLQYAYSSRNNVKITVNEFTRNGIILTIVDTNELPYDYAHYYTIERKIKNPDYPGIVQKLGEDTENSIAGYTRNRCRVYF